MSEKLASLIDRAGLDPRPTERTAAPSGLIPLRPAPRHVHAGEVLLGKGGEELRAVLGSCVAVTLWHPNTRIGAMSHVLLPRRRMGMRAWHGEGDARYAGDSLSLMFELLRAEGIDPRTCVGKIFGGAQVFAGSGSSVGISNVHALRALLDHAGVPVLSECVEGTGYRVIRFIVETGDVWVSHRKRPISGS